MSLLSRNLINEILDVAETYAAKEKSRLSQLPSTPPAAPAERGRPREPAPRARTPRD